MYTNSIRDKGIRFIASKALDGNTKTYWLAQPNRNNLYIVIDLRAPHTLNRIAINNFGDLRAPPTLNRIAINNFGDIKRGIEAFRLQKSQVGSPYNWKDVMPVTYVQIGTDRRQEFGGFQETARYWRLLVIPVNSRFQPALRELNFYGFPSGKRNSYLYIIFITRYAGSI